MSTWSYFYLAVKRLKGFYYMECMNFINYSVAPYVTLRDV